jgi:hypothetical protein
MRKKAQHEIMGFVLIVIIVMIIGLVVFSFFAGRTGSKSQTSAELSHLLNAVTIYTSDCAVGYIPDYRDGQKLIKACYNNDICLDGRNSCDALNSTIKETVSKSLRVSEDSPTKAYKIRIYYKDSFSNVDEELINFQEGVFTNCSNKLGSIHSIPESPGIINIELETCLQV